MNYTHVLISRPQPEAGQLADGIAAAGLVPVVIPAYRFAAHAPGSELESFARATGRKLAVFTSKRAVEFGLRQLPGELLEGAEVAAIGPATAGTLQARGFPVSIVPEGGFTSELLLEHPKLAKDPGVALLVTAPGGRTALSEGLQLKGWKVFTTFVYRREDLAPLATEVGKLTAGGGVISVWTSQNAMEALAGALPPSAWSRVCGGVAVVVSERLGQALKAAGFGRVVMANGPGNEQLLARVLELI